ncbi:Hsp70 family protein [Dactylosporangium sp. NPDC048998]|uniref:Hsp70 family protein n=1 Tax=Dactylosporangium sp. NPDC048998 TaxID=3363976 RepID=UPI00370FFD08
MYRLAIDFGTSTTVGVLRDDGGRVRPLLFGASPLLASGVFVPAGGGKPLTGADAQRAALSQPAASRVPLVATLLHRALRVAPITLDLPELVVAEGALLSAATPVDAAAVPPPRSAGENLRLAERLLRIPSARADGESVLRALVDDPDRAVARRARELWYANGLGAVPGRRRPTDSDPVVGIDLGTTNASVGILEHGRVCLVPNAEGAHTTPSVVAVTADGAVLAGAAAARQAMTNPDGTVRAAKLLVGTGWSISRGGVRYTAEDLLTRLVARLHVDAESHVDGPVRGAVLTVPASFDQRQRLALAGAARRAGLEVLRVLNEPTAAALAHSLHRGAEETVLVFDLGGGTFDVSLVEMGEGVIEIKSTAGDPRLGGDDWDRRIVGHLTSLIRQRYGLDVTGLPAALERLRDAAERAKVELSSAGSAEIGLPYLGSTDAGPVHVAETLTRATFEHLTRDLLNRCRGPVERVLRDAGIGIAAVDRVVLAGGAARMPAVAGLVRELTGGRAPYRGLPPEGVVMGATFQAGVLAGDVKDVLLLDVTSLGLGIEIAAGAMLTVIERNTTIPNRITALVTTAADDQDSVLLRVFEGDHPVATSNTALAAFELTGLPPAPAGEPVIEVCFDIDANGLLDVSATDRRSRSKRSMTIDQAATASASALAGADIPADRLPALPPLPPPPPPTES